MKISIPLFFLLSAFYIAITMSVYIWVGSMPEWTMIQIYVILWMLWIAAFYWMTRAKQISEWVLRTIPILVIIPIGIGIMARLIFNSGFGVWKLALLVLLTALMIFPIIGWFKKLTRQ